MLSMLLIAEPLSVEAQDDTLPERRRGLRIRQHRPVKIFEPSIARYFGGRTEDISSAGLRIEALGMGTNGVTVSGQNVSVGARGVVAFLAKADYYLTTTSVRPFLAFGAGLYLVGSSSAQASATTAAVSTESFTGFGVCPQVGLNLGAFRLAAAYNVITGGDSTTATFGNVALPSKNYFSFDIGGTFGGARSSP